MSDQQKIWFIYLTDHHEGPFTAEEIADKAKSGLVNGQSLAWKDGMAEWVPAETIPELAAAMTGGGGAPAAAPASDSISLTVDSAAAPAAAAPADTNGGEVSLAQLLAQSQQGGGGTAEVTPSGQITGAASVLSSMTSAVQSQASGGTQTGLSLGGGAPSLGGAEPGPDDEVWTLKIGGQVSGLHTLKKLKDLAASGEIPSDAMLWHPGWSDFQPVSAVGQVDGARKAGKPGAAKAGGATRTGITRPGVAMTAAPDDDEPTDTEIEAPPKGFKGILFKLKAIAEKLKKKKAAKAAPAAAKAKAAAPAAAVGAVKGKAAGKGGGALKRVASLLVGLLIGLAAVGGGAYYYLFLMNPISSDLDVIDDDRLMMNEVVKQKDGHRLYLAQAKGTEDAPADASTPKYYVASNLPEGTLVTLTVTGVPGTLVNKTSFEKTYTANVEKNHLAVFSKIDDEGKPIWGEVNMKVAAEGAEPLDAGKRFIGQKGAAYTKRLKTFKESVQGDYDKEITELREFITTLKNLQVETSKQVAEYKKDWATPSMRSKITADWNSFNKNSQPLLGQLDTNLKARQAPDKAPKYHARAFQDVSTTVGQLEQLLKAHGERMSGATPGSNADELDGLVQAGVQALEAWLATAVSKTPFDGRKDEASPPPAAPSAAPAAPAVPAAGGAPAPAAAAPATASAPAAAPATPPAAAPAAAPAAGGKP